MPKLPDTDKLIELIDDVLKTHRLANLPKEAEPIAVAIESSDYVRELRMAIAAICFHRNHDTEAAIAVATSVGMIMGVKLAEMIETYNLVKSAEATKSDA